MDKQDEIKENEVINTIKKGLASKIDLRPATFTKKRTIVGEALDGGDIKA